MTPELTYLTYSVILLIAHMVIQGAANALVRGIPWALGARDEAPDVGPVPARLSRALTNYVYNLPAFIALALMLKVTDAGTATTALGAAIWFWSRVVYIPVYASGLPLMRSVVWLVSLAGLAMMIGPLL